MPFTDLIPWKRGSKVPVKQENAPVPPLQHEMNRLFDNFFGGRSMPLSMFGEWDAFSPQVDIVENDKEVKVTAELPGLDENDIEVTLAHDTLSISGEKKQEHEEKGRNYYHSERSFGSFHRTITLPCDIEEDNIEATFKNGVLNIVLPKTKASRNCRHIEIKG